MLYLLFSDEQSEASPADSESVIEPGNHFLYFYWTSLNLKFKS